MKTSEFIKQVEELGYETDKINRYIYIKNKGITVAYVRETRVNTMDTNYQYGDVSYYLFNLIIEYAKTPLEDREEEKKYYIKPKGMKTLYNNSLGYIREAWMTSNRVANDDDIQVQFTLKELEELGIDVEHYDLEEVE